LKGVPFRDAFFCIFDFYFNTLMRLKISLLIFALLFILGPSPSCMKKYEPNEVIKVSLCSINSQLVDNSGAEPKHLSGDTVKAKAFAFYLSQSFKDLASICSNPSWFNFNVGNMALASCESKIIYSYNLVDSIKNISIHCNPQFNSDYSANSDVSNIFKVYTQHMFKDFKSIGSVLDDFSGSVKVELTSNQLITLQELPDVSDTYIFTIRLLHKSGLETVHHLEPVYLKL